MTDYDCGMIAAGALLTVSVRRHRRTSLANFTAIASVFHRKIHDSSTAPPEEIWSLWRRCGKSRSADPFCGCWTRRRRRWVRRLLRTYLEQPLIDKEEIEKRQDAIEELNADVITREELREYLNPVYDLERLISTYQLSDRQSQGSDCLPQFHCHAAADQIAFWTSFQSDAAGRTPRGSGYAGGVCATDRPGYYGGTAHLASGTAVMIKDGYNEEVDSLPQGKDRREDLAG